MADVETTLQNFPLLPSLSPPSLLPSISHLSPPEPPLIINNYNKTRNNNNNNSTNNNNHFFFFFFLFSFSFSFFLSPFPVKYSGLSGVLLWSL